MATSTKRSEREETMLANKMLAALAAVEQGKGVQNAYGDDEEEAVDDCPGHVTISVEDNGIVARVWVKQPSSSQRLRLVDGALSLVKAVVDLEAPREQLCPRKRCQKPMTLDGPGQSMADGESCRPQTTWRFICPEHGLYFLGPRGGWMKGRDLSRYSLLRQ